MTTQIKKSNDELFQQLSDSLENEWNSKQIATIQNQVAKDTSIVELSYFLNTAKSVGLNPFNKEIWCYKDKKGNLIIFTGRDGMLKKAQDNPNFAGMRSAEVKENDEFSIDIANNDITHKITEAERGKIIGAYAIVFRSKGEPTVSYVEFRRYNKAMNHEWKKNVWNTHPEEMIKKVAESKALKLAFGLSGVQVEYDFDINDGVAEPASYEVIEKRTITNENFDKFIKQSDSYIEKHKHKFDFTDSQKKNLDIRLSEHG
jgi:phage recombination protein Bet